MLISGISSSVSKCPTAPSSSESTSPVSQIPSISFISNNVRDRFWGTLFQKGFIDENNLVTDQLTESLPEIDLLDSIEKLLNTNRTVRGESKTLTFEVVFNLLEMLNYLKSKLVNKLISIQIFGGAVPWVLGPDYAKQALQKLGFVDISPELLRDFMQQPLDVDFRFILSANATEQDLYDFNEMIITFFGQKAFGPNCDNVQRNAIRLAAFKGVKPIFEEEKGDQHVNQFTIIGFKTSDGLAFDLVAARKLKWQHLFSHDALILPLDNLFDPDKKTKKLSIELKSSWNHPSQTMSGKVWQGFLDRLGGILRLEEGKVLEEGGFYKCYDLNWLARLLSNYVKGKTSIQPLIFEKMYAMLDQYVAQWYAGKLSYYDNSQLPINLSIELANVVANTAREKHLHAMAIVLGHYLNRMVANHHEKSLSVYTALMLQFNALTGLQGDDKRKLIGALWGCLLDAQQGTEEDSKCLFACIGKILKLHPNMLELVSLWLQIRAYLQLAHEVSHDGNSVNVQLAMHNQPPAMEIWTGKANILIPLDTTKTLSRFKELYKCAQEQERGQLMALDELYFSQSRFAPHASLLQQANTLKSNFEVDFTNFENNGSLLGRLHFEAALFSYSVDKSQKGFMPIANILPQLLETIPNSEGRIDLVQRLLTHAKKAPEGKVFESMRSLLKNPDSNILPLAYLWAKALITLNQIEFIDLVYGHYQNAYEALKVLKKSEEVGLEFGKKFATLRLDIPAKILTQLMADGLAINRNFDALSSMQAKISKENVLSLSSKAFDVLIDHLVAIKQNLKPVKDFFNCLSAIYTQQPIKSVQLQELIEFLKNALPKENRPIEIANDPFLASDLSHLYLAQDPSTAQSQQTKELLVWFKDKSKSKEHHPLASKLVQSAAFNAILLEQREEALKLLEAVLGKIHGLSIEPEGWQEPNCAKILLFSSAFGNQINAAKPILHAYGHKFLVELYTHGFYEQALSLWTKMVSHKILPDDLSNVAEIALQAFRHSKKGLTYLLDHYKWLKEHLAEASWLGHVDYWFEQSCKLEINDKTLLLQSRLLAEKKIVSAVEWINFFDRALQLQTRSISFNEILATFAIAVKHGEALEGDREEKAELFLRLAQLSIYTDGNVSLSYLDHLPTILEYYDQHNFQGFVKPFFEVLAEAMEKDAVAQAWGTKIYEARDLIAERFQVPLGWFERDKKLISGFMRLSDRLPTLVLKLLSCHDYANAAELIGRRVKNLTPDDKIGLVVAKFFSEASMDLVVKVLNEKNLQTFLQTEPEPLSALLRPYDKATNKNERLTILKVILNVIHINTEPAVLETWASLLVEYLESDAQASQLAKSIKNKHDVLIKGLSSTDHNGYLYRLHRFTADPRFAIPIDQLQAQQYARALLDYVQNSDVGSEQFMKQNGMLPKQLASLKALEREEWQNLCYLLIGKVTALELPQMALDLIRIYTDSNKAGPSSKQEIQWLAYFSNKKAFFDFPNLQDYCDRLFSQQIFKDQAKKIFQAIHAQGLPDDMKFFPIFKKHFNLFSPQFCSEYLERLLQMTLKEQELLAIFEIILNLDVELNRTTLWTTFFSKIQHMPLDPFGMQLWALVTNKSTLQKDQADLCGLWEEAFIYFNRLNKAVFINSLDHFDSFYTDLDEVKQLSQFEFYVQYLCSAAFFLPSRKSAAFERHIDKVVQDLSHFYNQQLIAYGSAGTQDAKWRGVTELYHSFENSLKVSRQIAVLRFNAAPDVLSSDLLVGWLFQLYKKFSIDRLAIFLHEMTSGLPDHQRSQLFTKGYFALMILSHKENSSRAHTFVHQEMPCEMIMKHLKTVASHHTLWNNTSDQALFERSFDKLMADSSRLTGDLEGIVKFDLAYCHPLLTIINSLEMTIGLNIDLPQEALAKLFLEIPIDKIESDYNLIKAVLRVINLFKFRRLGAFFQPVVEHISQMLLNSLSKFPSNADKIFQIFKTLCLEQDFFDVSYKINFIDQYVSEFILEPNLSIEELSTTRVRAINTLIDLLRSFKWKWQTNLPVIATLYDHIYTIQKDLHTFEKSDPSTRLLIDGSLDSVLSEILPEKNGWQIMFMAKLKYLHKLMDANPVDFKALESHLDHFLPIAMSIPSKEGFSLGDKLDEIDKMVLYSPPRQLKDIYFNMLNKVLADAKRKRLYNNQELHLLLYSPFVNFLLPSKQLNPQVYQEAVSYVFRQLLNLDTVTAIKRFKIVCQYFGIIKGEDNEFSSQIRKKINEEHAKKPILFKEHWILLMTFAAAHSPLGIVEDAFITMQSALAEIRMTHVNEFKGIELDFSKEFLARRNKEYVSRKDLGFMYVGLKMQILFVTFALKTGFSDKLLLTEFTDNYCRLIAERLTKLHRDRALELLDAMRQLLLIAKEIDSDEKLKNIWIAALEGAAADNSLLSLPIFWEVQLLKMEI